jgi:hypothetical protein
MAAQVRSGLGDATVPSSWRGSWVASRSSSSMTGSGAGASREALKRLRVRITWRSFHERSATGVGGGAGVSSTGSGTTSVARTVFAVCATKKQHNARSAALASQLRYRAMVFWKAPVTTRGGAGSIPSRRLHSTGSPVIPRS